MTRVLSLLLMLWVTQVPCASNEPTTVCHCKQGQLSACAAVRVTDPRLADELEKAALLAVKLEQARRQTAKDTESQASSDSPEPPDCEGQNHHVISKPIAKALERHETLRGVYRPRDPRFQTQAVDEEAHCGYQDWHRKLDAEVIAWLARNRKATPKEFEAYLREIYNRPEMLARFPRGF
ncbi:Wall-associated protein precursor [Hyalangium rubrum]|uniref:Wall-associated protein n=1 Tax=Hyalangium rubrum TaxID=3103134 RepID=A0ABU5H332_9BACT|nr:Wall-associated protein precursor [Hyalangium sp. s54d21]MDY7227203.1 Wall-associated protein precursor [Hyalangium sp. s54d21]